MDESDKATQVVEEDRASPPGMVRRRLLVVFALLALVGAVISLASLRLADSTPTQLGVDDRAASGLPPTDLTGGLPGLGGVLPGVLAPVAPIGLPGLPGVVPAANPPAAAPPAAAPPAAAQTVAVSIMNFTYSPASVSIAPGDTVTWTNHDTAPHNVVVSGGPERFTSPTLQTGQSFSFRFTQAGTYAYYCSIHPNMKATVTVQGGTAPPPGHPPPGQPGNCVSQQSLDAFMAHVKSAHLERSLFQQITDILAIDQYVLTHTVWLENVLQPVFNGSADQVVKDTLAPVMAHINSAHLERSPLQQVDDILATDQYILSHTVWLENVLAPLAGQLTC